MILNDSIPISPSLLSAIKENGYRLIFAPISKPAYLLTKEKAIVLSDNLLEQSNPHFAIAHELGHLMSQHEELAILYTGSSTLHSKMEYEANYFAIKNTLDIYVKEHNLDYSDVNYIKFMQAYDIPTFLTDCVEKICRDELSYNRLCG